MITNEREYRITRAQLRGLEAGLVSATQAPSPQGVHPLLATASREALIGEIEELRSQLNDYDQLKAGRKRIWVIDSFGTLPDVVIQARIASGMTQKNFADVLRVKEQQVQRYEITKYRGVSWERLEQAVVASGLQCQILAWLGTSANSLNQPSTISVGNLASSLLTTYAASPWMSNAGWQSLAAVPNLWLKTVANIPYQADLLLNTPSEQRITESKGQLVTERVSERTGMGSNRVEALSL